MSDRDLHNLIARYAELVDTGDFAGVGELFAEGTYSAGFGSASGAADVTKAFQRIVILYPDGTPRTKHVTTNTILELDGDTAAARSYFTVFQAVADLLPLQPIASGRYHDTFTRRDGQWRFTERRVTVDLAGDLRHHLHQIP
ncbi:nuclear transport factor 2 family protein [Actinocrispum sp. NPDC049592]|uniref:nuclear transport factor 2 family protein n=1 Tax=Actinocrispum sp. NPDC049592 TaxID=3154835 RepID=UPI0034289231